MTVEEKGIKIIEDIKKKVTPLNMSVKSSSNYVTVFFIP